MRNFRLWMAAIMTCLVWSGTFAHVPDNYRKPSSEQKVKYRTICAGSTSQIDQEINNVRARLLGGGDCWWDFTDGRYIVPKVDVSTGQREVSSIFAGSVWLGGVDPAGNLKLACQDYRSGGANDFWPGPLSELGLTEGSTCSNWDRHFRVTGEEIRRHLANLANGNLSEDAIPRGVKGWPARGNPYFADVWGFSLPDTEQALAGFFDAGEADDYYDPLEGDYPSIEIRGCPLDRFPDEMIFWIYNDQGGGAVHARTQGSPIQMEVQVQSFGYVTNDELNDMTFQRYKLINRALDRIDSTFFAMWVDADLGCYTDDYVGCDTTNNLMYVYNQDPLDGTNGCQCQGNVATYCDKVPILGVDYFRGPLDTFGEEIGMSSFVYYNNPGIGNWPAAMTDPQLPLEFYRYLTGHWRDGSPFTYGGSGYQSGGAELRYALTDPPNSANGWSMCTANLAFGDRRTLQASGPFTLKPGAVNELIIGVPWVPDIQYPCPDLENLLRADKLAQGLFDNCFEIPEGPDAPKVDWIELHQEIVAVLTNPEPSNNVDEAYAIEDIFAPDSLKNSPDPAVRESIKYKFEGYKIFQLINPNVSNAEFETDPAKSRLVYQVDIRNGVSTLYNWTETFNPADPTKPYYIPVLQVQGENKGIRHTFSIKDDKFAASDDKRLINHKKYYFAVIAYGHNNYDTFNPTASPATGQQRPYIPSRKNYDGTQISIITVIPRPIVDQALQSSYGDGVVITRLEGAGNGGNFLDIDSITRERIITGQLTDSVLTYKLGRGPIAVTIFNPFEVVDGDYELRFVDDNNTDAVLRDTARWELRRLPNGEVIAAERTINEINEQIVAQYGFSVSIAQQPPTGSRPLLDETNGAIGAEIEYANPNLPWLLGYPDQDDGIFDFVKTGFNTVDNPLDPNKRLSTLGNGWFVPYVLCDWRLGAINDTFRPFFTPAWTEKAGSVVLNATANGNETARRNKLGRLRNVDIVMTSDKSKWSRCVVVETASWLYTSPEYAAFQDPTLQTESPAGRRRVSFDARFAPSVGKDDANNDGLPDPDGAVAPPGAPDAGQPLLGMGWFPGYAIDVETGQRLNIFFGENSCYSSALNPAFTGRDMLWNPTDQALRQTGGFTSLWDFIMGGQHFVYVMNTPYDECEALRRRITPELFSAGSFKVQQIANIDWCGMIQLSTGAQLRPLREGLIPNETTIKLRTARPYQTWFNDNDGGKKTGHPRYQFTIKDRESLPLTQVQVGNALDSIKVVPNPYYGFSQYETSQFTNTIKITNLPGICTVTIYSLDGKFIRQYQRAETYAPYRQISDALEWDLRNNKGIPVASGVYLIHVNAPDMGERTIKWFGIARQFDPSGL